MLKMMLAGTIPILKQNIKEIRILSFDVAIEHKNGKTERLGMDELCTLLDELKIDEDFVTVEYES